MYQIQFTKSFEKQFKKLPKNIQLEVYDWSEKLQSKPFPRGSRILKGNWNGIVALHFHKRPEYRLLYLVTEPDDELKSGMLTLLMIATREQMNNLYRLGKKRIKDILSSSIDMY